jgi:hypothetical protein
MMSKPQKPETARPPLWLITSIIGGVVVIAIVLLAVSSGSQTTAYQPEVSGKPHAEVAQAEVDHGTQRFGQFVESVFTIRNIGDKPLTILHEPRVEIVEGCCPPRVSVSSATTQPGEETVVTLRYTMHEGMGGPHEFRVHVLTNDPTQTDVILTARSTWEA